MRSDRTDPPTPAETARMYSGDLGADPMARRDAALTAFYGLQPYAPGADPGAYAFTWDAQQRMIPVATKHEWLDWRLPVEIGAARIPGLDIACVGSRPAPDHNQAEAHFHAHIEGLRKLGKVMSHDPQCRLVAADGRSIHFGHGRYDDWRVRGTGLLEDELQLALMRTSGDPPEEAANAMHWRRRMMNDLRSVVDVGSRMCLGGVQVVTVWRPTATEPWKILHSRRSEKQGDNPHAKQCLPRGFHEPPVPEDEAAEWSFCEQVPRSVVREFGEELLGLKLLGNMKVLHSHMSLLRGLEGTLHDGGAKLWANGLVFSLDNGNYELLFTLLIDERCSKAIEKFKRTLPRSGRGPKGGTLWQLNWEAPATWAADRGPKELKLHPAELAVELGRSKLAEWVPGSRAAIIETLMLLRGELGLDVGGTLGRR